MELKFAKRFKELRFEVAKTQKQVADDLEVTQSTVAKWENGDLEPNLSALLKIAYYFKVTTDYLLGMEE